MRIVGLQSLADRAAGRMDARRVPPPAARKPRRWHCRLRRDQPSGATCSRIPDAAGWPLPSVERPLPACRAGAARRRGGNGRWTRWSPGHARSARSGRSRGKAAWAPRLSSATATIMKFAVFRRSNSCCHSGKSKRQPHQDAHVVSNTFLPRKFASKCGMPARSGRVTSGATSPFNEVLRSSAPVPSTQISLDVSTSSGLPRGRQNAARSTRPASFVPCCSGTPIGRDTYPRVQVSNL